MKIGNLLEELESKIEKNVFNESEQEHKQSMAAMREIRKAAEIQADRKIREIIMSPEFKFFAPDNENWHQALAEYMNPDSEKFYAAAMEKYTEQDMDNLWQNSHINSCLSEEEIKSNLINAICKLKMLQKMEKICDLDEAMQEYIREGLIARTIGLYNLLYE